MDTLRATWRLVGFVMISLVTLLLYVCGLLFTFWSRRARVRWKSWVIARWAGLVARLIGLRITVSGTAPDPPFVLVSNHLSYIDILPLWKHMPTTFVAKQEVSRWPLIGAAARILGIIFIDRGNNRDLRRVNEMINDELGEAQGVTLFPEGTSSRGEQVLPFKSSLLFYPAVHQLPVRYAAISYRILQAGKDGTVRAWQDVCWWGDSDFISHFWNLLKIRSFEASVHLGPEAIRHDDRKVLTARLQQAVEDSFTPTYPR